MFDTPRQGRAYFLTQSCVKEHTLIVITDLRALHGVGSVGRKRRKELVFPLFCVAQLLERMVGPLLRQCSQMGEKRLHVRPRGLRVLLAVLPPARSGVACKVLLGKKHPVPIPSVEHCVRFEDILSFADEFCKLLGLVAAIF
jgi:hypothetical protein